jgi:peroxiredoxin (alkyl hydroperoxide reductase subunit C)
LNFPLLADFWPHGAVAEAYGVFNTVAGVSNRGTFLVDVDGVVRFSEANEIGVGRDPEVWLRAIDELATPVAG